MANKVIDISSTPVKTDYTQLSQTPINYDEKNFYVHTLQQKVDIEWPYRPNRVLVEYEEGWDTEDYWKSTVYPHLLFKPLEVIVQAVKTDKGTDIAQDCRRLVFRNIRESRFNIGNKFKFSDDYDYKAPEEDKNVWLVTNKDSVTITSSVVIERCNGTIGSIYYDEQNIAHYHYEPVIQGRDLSATTLQYNQVAISPQSALTIICQHNKYTAQYQLNQRFVIGYDRVYRIKAINKFYSNNTNNPKNVGLMHLYLEITEVSPYDDFVHRIAYEQEPIVHVQEEGKLEHKYYIGFNLPNPMPHKLTDEEIKFEPVLLDSDNKQYENINVVTQCTLENWPQEKGFDMNNNPYFVFRQEGNIFYLQRKKIYLNGQIVIKCSVPAEQSPSGEEITAEVQLLMNTF